MLASSDINIAAFYLPPSLDVTDVIETVSAGIAGLDLNAPTIIGGDFNCQIDGGSDSSEGDALLDVMTERGLRCANSPDEPTYVCHNGQSTIDLLFHNLEDANFSGLEVMDSPARKHFPVRAVICTRSLGWIHVHPVSVPTTRLKLSLLEDGTGQIRLGNGVDDSCESIESVIRAAMRWESKKTRRARPWFTRECYKSHREALRLLQIARDTTASPKLLAERKAEYVRQRRTYIQLCRSSKQEHAMRAEERLLEKVEANP